MLVIVRGSAAVAALMMIALSTPANALSITPFAAGSDTDPTIRAIGRRGR